VGETLAKSQRRFFWQGVSIVRKYFMVKWKHICKPRNKGGLGLKIWKNEFKRIM
jgi:hypothetical protein